MFLSLMRSENTAKMRVMYQDLCSSLETRLWVAGYQKGPVESNAGRETELYSAGQCTCLDVK